MRVAYLDCFSGISGDMALGALVACGADPGALRADLAGLHLPGWELTTEPVSVNGIGAVRATVHVAPDTGHGRHLADIEEMISGAGLPERATQRALDVFRLLARAEAHVHQTTPDRIHFHEVGAVDSIIDIVGTCAALERLGVDEVRCSPLPMGHGFVTCSHGVIPLPAPAVLEVLAGAPVYGVDVEGELVTPTGAALAAALSAGFGPYPRVAVGSSGYGAGTKRFADRPNVLRVVVGTVEAGADTPALEVDVVEANIDDLSPQFYEVVSERLFAAGALDVFLTAVQMKKGRPGTLLTVACEPTDTDRLAEIVFAETTTLGVRRYTAQRVCLPRAWVRVPTPFGAVRIKEGRSGGEVVTAAPEYADVKAAAASHGVPARRVHLAAMTAYENGLRED